MSVSAGIATALPLSRETAKRNTDSESWAASKRKAPHEQARGRLLRFSCLFFVFCLCFLFGFYFCDLLLLFPVDSCCVCSLLIGLGSLLDALVLSWPLWGSS